MDLNLDFMEKLHFIICDILPDTQSKLYYVDGCFNCLHKYSWYRRYKNVQI